MESGDSPTPMHRAKLGLRGRAMKNFLMCSYPIGSGRKVWATGSHTKHWTSELAFQPTRTCSAAIAFHRCPVKSLCQQCCTPNSHTTHSRIHTAFLYPVRRGRKRELMHCSSLSSRDSLAQEPCNHHSSCSAACGPQKKLQTSCWHLTARLHAKLQPQQLFHSKSDCLKLTDWVKRWISQSLGCHLDVPVCAWFVSQLTLIFTYKSRTYTDQEYLGHNFSFGIDHESNLYSSQVDTYTVDIAVSPTSLDFRSYASNSLQNHSNIKVIGISSPSERAVLRFTADHNFFTFTPGNFNYLLTCSVAD